MDDEIRRILDQIGTLENELKAALDKRETPVTFFVDGQRVSLRSEHKESFLRWLVTRPILALLVAPVIYGLILPLAFLDLGISLYQAVCFPVYGIARTRRKDYLSMDRWRLDYLNVAEKINCAYCAYANGILAYSAEVAARTEQYFCPIKHAHKVLGTHARYARFLSYGDADGYHARLESFREALSPRDENATQARDDGR